MSSTTIRYSGVPENSHSRDFESDTAAYTPASRHEEPDPLGDSDLTRRFRAAAAADRAVSAVSADPEPAASSGSASGLAQGGTGSAPDLIPGERRSADDDPRHNRAYSHPQNPGLFEEVDGFYDWAGRRLFLADGSPDPMTPGAYRYQTRPDLCDLDAPDSDPSSPRFEPDHLRHKPGDDWLIDTDRPYDVLDPGPFGSPDWFPDRRTGRHRRNELPDPIPWWEIEEEPEKAEWAEHAEALYERRTRITREREAREAETEAAARTAAHEAEQAAAREAETAAAARAAAYEAEQMAAREAETAVAVHAAAHEAEQVAARDADAAARRNRQERNDRDRSERSDHADRNRSGRPDHSDSDRSGRSDHSDRSGGNGAGGSGAGSPRRWGSGSEPSSRSREDSESARAQGGFGQGRRRSPVPRRGAGWSQADRNSEDPPEPVRPGLPANRSVGGGDTFAAAGAPHWSDGPRETVERPSRSDETRQVAGGSERFGGTASGCASAGAAEVFTEVPHRFDKLREDAWDRFLVKSAELAAAHRTNRTAPAGERDGGPVGGRFARLVRAVAGAFKHRQGRQGDPRDVRAAASIGTGDGSAAGAPGPVEPPAATSIPRPREAASLSGEVSTPHGDASGSREVHMLRGAASRPGEAPRPREAAARTAIALRTSRFAQAIRGAERARTEIHARRSVRTAGAAEAGLPVESAFGGAVWA
ncbi:hypothetical protein [Glycomyces albidus]|uniref:Uncharacterized protein n=1 Tax=Glycomyces albidus TaxID=2656774 RepID=A0A6L5GG98_9ACTN|nr:hypothetical protein [Glycomyces albidus]MQM28383.1 hypothetical protein [Glycomyces albidus]